MHRYWFVFDGDARALPAGLTMGCGATATSRAQAEAMIRRDLVAGGELPPIAQVVEDIDLSELDPDHVLPNVGAPNVQGVWFPRP